MTEVSNFEKYQTASIPGAETLLPVEPQTSFQRAQDYPVVKDSLAQAQTLIHSNQYAEQIYQTATSIATAVLDKLQPLQDRLPLERIENYANQTLDYVETKFPQVKEPTGDLLKTARKPADDAASVAKAYADGFQSRVSSTTEQISARIVQGQDAIHALQEKLKSTIAALPHDQASAKETIESIRQQVESLSTYLSENAKSLPSHAQSRAQPLIDSITEATTHIRDEISKSDTPLTTKATNVLSYSQSQLTPLLNSAKEVLLGVKQDVKKVAEEAPKTNGH